MISALFALFIASASCASKDDFVKTNGMRFQLKGQDHYVFSANYWQAMNLGAIDAAQGNRTRLINDLDAMKRMGINNLRIMASSEGPNGEPYRMDPALMNKPGEYNQQVLDGLDFAMAEIGKRGMKAVMCMNNFWPWSGGMSQYVSWATGEKIPYPPSWDPKLGDYSQGDWGKYMDFTAQFYNNQKVSAQAQRWYLDHIQFIMNHVNKYTGVAYKDDPTVFSWGLVNEPVYTPTWWTEASAKYIKTIAPHQLVTDGTMAHEIDHNNPYNDYCAIHLWVQNAGVYNMLDPSEKNIANAIVWGKGNIDKANEFAKKVNKPLILEEFGMPRDNWQAKDKSGWYSPTHTTTNKDRYFKEILAYTIQLRKQGGSYAGFGFWAYSGESRPGDRWIADPPHEAPGWYSVYDTDASTIKVMKDVVASV